MERESRASWGARSVERPAPDLSSGPGLRVVSSSRAQGSRLGVEPTEKRERDRKQNGELFRRPGGKGEQTLSRLAITYLVSC